MSAIAMVSRFIMIEPKYSKSEPAIFISVGVLRRQLLQQRLRLFQIARVETFGEPAVDRSEQFASLLRLPLVAPEACEPNGGGLANPLRELTEGSRRNVTALPSEPTKHVNGRTWPPDQSGNPNGQPVGSRSAFGAAFLPGPCRSLVR